MAKELEQYKTLVIKLVLDAWIEATAIAGDIDLLFSGQDHRRFLRNLIGLYHVTDPAQVAGLHDSEYVADVLDAVQEFEEIALMRAEAGGMQKQVLNRCTLVDGVIQEACDDMARFRTEVLGEQPSAAETVARILREHGLHDSVVTGMTKKPLSERVKNRKLRRRWLLHTPAGRAYLRALVRRRHQHHHVDPKRVKKSKEVARLYKV
ncbi:MAG: hypothetical protein IPK50_13865 [Fibrobacterota bacterium]|nr:MAG: hypothetical protein IPK50_13865 [Fibrobacterota bacterium]